MGLLSAAEKNTVLSVKTSFQEWAEKKGLSHCGVFCSEGGLMLLKYAYGMDVQTVFKSISTKDFWNGSVRSGSWITLDRESPNFSAFTQFLSPEAKEDAKCFRLLKFLDKKNLFIYFEYSTKDGMFHSADGTFVPELLAVMTRHKQNLNARPTIKDVEDLAQHKRTRLALISLKLAYEETENNIEVSELSIQRTLSNTIFDELFFITKKLFAKPDCIYSENSQEIKIAAVISSDTEDEIIKEQLYLEYKGILGEKTAQKVIILTAGYSDHTEEILNYLLRG